jgi:pimeloyl-ACP methyl ester carboxylesterase
MPGIDECGKSLGDFLDKLPESDQLFLVGHSMGGLVIQSLLAQTRQEQRGIDLAKIRCVIRFATPNLGSTILSGLRGIFSILRENPCGVFSSKKCRYEQLPSLISCVLGLQDDVVPEVSARASFFIRSFVEASPLSGDTKRSCDAVQMIPTTRDTRPSRTHSLTL